MNSDPGDRDAGIGDGNSDVTPSDNDAPGSWGQATEPTDSSADRSTTAVSDRVLVVDDEPAAADLAATYLERLLDGVETVTASSPETAMERLRDHPIDCVVSDHDMPGATGLDLLADVRAEIGDLPFILFTGKGSEEIASEAISAGVTDYLQKGGGADGYEMLANRVDNALSRQRAEADLRAINRKVTAIHEFATEVSTAESVEDVFERVVDVAERVLEFDRCITARRDGEYVRPAALSEGVTVDEVRRFELGEGVAGRTVAEERTFVIDELDRSSDADPVADDIGSAISVPIGGHGLLQAVSSCPASFDETDVEFAELVTTHACEAIDQIETENALRAERDRLAALFDNVPLPIARIVVDADGTQHLDETNDAFEATFGHSSADSGYEETREAITPEHADRVAPDVFEGDDPIREEVQRRTVDGVRDFLLNGIPVSRSEGKIVYSVYADIDDQKRVERTLKGLHEATREMFRGEDRETVANVAARAAIDTLGFPNSGVRLYDPESGTLHPTAITEEATDAVGEHPPIGPGDGTVWETFEQGEATVIDDIDASTTEIEYGDLRSLLVVPLGDHGVMPLGSRERGFFDEHDIQLARVLAANVTVALDRAERTEQLRERDAELQRSLDRHEKFAAVISHDLRNPLTVASGRVRLLRDRVDETNDEALTEIEHIETAHDRMAELIDDVLTLARQGRTVDTAESVDLAAAAREAWGTVDTDGGVLETPDSDVMIEADPERLRTLLENLFRNSIEHGSRGGGSGMDGSSGVTVTVEALPDGFAVSDDGPGFDRIDPSEALQRGVTSAESGSGFGLAIVGEIAEAHGWRTTVADDDGAGFEFCPEE